MSLKSSKDLRVLLRDFVAGRNREGSFRKISNHLGGLIFHAALRQSGDAGLAEDVTQNVLVQISRKAGKLSKHPEVLAWVHEATRLEVLQIKRAEGRRRKREEVAMRSVENEQVSQAGVLPDLDDSLRSLSLSERELVLMKFFEGRTYSGIAAITGRSESAEKMRLKRALEKMSKWFGKNGTVMSVGGMTAVLSTEMAKAAPAGLVTGMASAGAVSGVSGKLGTGISAMLVLVLGVPILKQWMTVRELTKQRIHATASSAEPSSRAPRFSGMTGRTSSGRVIHLEPTEEEWKMSLPDLAWKYERASTLKDAVTMERINRRLENLTHEELAGFFSLVGRPRPSELIGDLDSMMSGTERLDFLMRLGISKTYVRSEFQGLQPATQAAAWLIAREERGGLPKSLRYNYRTILWDDVKFRLGRLVPDESFKDREKMESLLLQCVERSPVEFRDSFEGMLAEFNGEGGGE